MESAFKVYQDRLKSQHTKGRGGFQKSRSVIKKKKNVINQNQKLKLIRKKTKELCNLPESGLWYSQKLTADIEDPLPSLQDTDDDEPESSSASFSPDKAQKRTLVNGGTNNDKFTRLPSPSPLDTHLAPEKIFDWLIYPMRRPDFFQTHWEKSAIHIKRSRSIRNRFEQLLSTEKLHSIFLENVLFYTRNIDVVSYSNGKRETHNAEGRAVPTALWDYYKNGCSIRVLNPQTYCEQLHSLLASLQEFFGCMVGVNAYLTPPGSQGFAPHYDDIEAFVLQLEGRKHWKLYSPRKPSEVLPRYSSKNFERDELAGVKVTEVTLKPGDVLYFPRGTIHEALADADKHSLHITVSVYQKTSYVDLMEHILKYTLNAVAAEDVEFRAGLPLQYLQHSGFVHRNTCTKSRVELKLQVKKLFSKMMDYLDIDSAADELGKKFMWDSMPPIPSDAEKKCMMYLNGEKLINGHINDSVDINLKTQVRLLRYHCVRLVKDIEGELRIYYNTDNSKCYHGEESQFVVIDDMFEGVVKLLVQCYPNFIEVDLLPLDNDSDKIQIVGDLWEKGLLVTKYPLDKE